MSYIILMRFPAGTHNDPHRRGALAAITDDPDGFDTKEWETEKECDDWVASEDGAGFRRNLPYQVVQVTI